MNRIIAIALLLLVSSFPAYGTQVAKQIQASAEALLPPSSPSNDQETIQVLKAQLDAEQQHNERILDTVYWAISFVGGLALLLLGASWFNTKVVHDRDIKSIQRQLSAEQSEAFGQIREQLTSDFSATIERDVGAKVAQETGAIRRTLTSLASSVKNTKHDLKALEHTGEIRYWRAQDVPANVLMQYRLMLEDVKSANDEYRISEALAGIQELLQQDAPVDIDEIPEFITAISGLPDHFSVNTQAIRQLLAQRRG